MTAVTSAPRGKMVNGFDPATATGLTEESRELVDAPQLICSARPTGCSTATPSRSRAPRACCSMIQRATNISTPITMWCRSATAIRAWSMRSRSRRRPSAPIRATSRRAFSITPRICSARSTGRSGMSMFTCTGSEANDLAVRMAKHHTGNQGIIITEEAYHGNSELTAGFSPSLGPYSPLGTYVRRVPAPDSYRIAPEKIGAWMAEKVSEQIVDLQRRGVGVAAFIADSDVLVRWHLLASDRRAEAGARCRAQGGRRVHRR